MTSLFETALLSNQSSYWLVLLFDLAIKGALILAVAALSTVALRRASAAVRHMVWNLALVSLLALPLLVVVLPRWDVPVLPGLLASHEAQEDARGVEAASEDIVQAAIQSAERRALSAARDEDASDAATPVAPQPDRAGTSLASLHWSMWILMAWLGGSLLVAARLAAGIASVWWIARQSARVEDAAWTVLAEDLSWQLGLTYPVALLESERVSMPLTWGLFRSAILLPSGARDWTEERRRVVLSHELAHVRRKDCLTQTLAQAACALYWFNPLVWIAARQLRMERERACDDHVLHTGTRASDYASHLLDIARSLRSSSCSSMTAVAIARRSQLEGRLLAILDPGLSRRGLNRAGAAIALVVMACVVLPLAAMRPLASDDQLKSGQPESTLREVTSDAAASRVREDGKGSLEEAAHAEPPENPASIEGEDPPSKTSPDQASGETEQPDNASMAEALNVSPNDTTGQSGNNQVVEALKQALRDSDWEVRKQAAWSLGLKGDSTSVDELIEALKDEHPEVREQAAWALGLRGDSRAVGPLCSALRDSNSGVREQAAWALGLKGNREAVAPLIEALRGDADEGVREQAAWALGLKGDGRAVEPLVATLADADEGVREQAAWALGLKGDRSALPALKDALKDASDQVRDQARWAIGMILIRGGAASGRGDDDDKEFEFDSEIISEKASEIISERVASSLSNRLKVDSDMKVNMRVKPNPSPRGGERYRK